MKKWILLSTLLSLDLFAANQTEYFTCDWGKSGTEIIMTKTTLGLQSTFAGLFKDRQDRKSFIAADACVEKRNFTRHYTQNISGLANVLAACVSITTDAGDGILAILRKPNRNSYVVEIKNFSVSRPNRRAGTSLSCDHVVN